MFSTSGRLAPASIDCVKVFSAGSASSMRADCCHGAMRACCQRSTVPGPLSVAPDRRSGPQQNLQRHASAGFCAVRGGKKGPAAVGPALPSPAAPAPATHGLDQRALRHVQSASPLRPPIASSSRWSRWFECSQPRTTTCSTTWPCLPVWPYRQRSSSLP